VRIIHVVLVSLILIAGCRGPKGDQGPAGAQGQSGVAGVTVYEGTVSNGTLSNVSLDPLTTSMIVAVFYALAADPSRYFQLGSHPGTESTAQPYGVVNYSQFSSTGLVEIHNVPAGSLYRIFVITPATTAAPLPSSGFGSRLLD